MSPYLLEEVKRFLRPSDSVLYECRNCGYTLEKEAEECPSCCSEDISKYEL
ncbi:hypothetical protein C455_00082 [Haloferax larsenii JCM 13917]|nr:hypothetical protein C455_00082 [Haloferax larsenii JCM 13917]